MTQHLLAEQTDEDVRTMRNLRIFIGGFVVVTVFLALGVSIFAP